MRKPRWLAVLLALALMTPLFPTSVLGASTLSSPFVDVIGTPYEMPVSALYDIGVVDGTSANTFSSGAPVTRAQMAVLLIRALNLTDAAKEQAAERFRDVPKGYWAFGEVSLAAERAYVKGVSETQFAPEAPVTYAQATVMALRALAYDNGNLEYPSGHVLLAKELGLLEGLNWSLDREMNRGEVAKLLANAVFAVPHKHFTKTLSQVHFRKAVAVDILPASEALLAGKSNLQAVGKDAYGKDLVIGQAQWTVTQGDATIDESGVLNGKSGAVTVQAVIGGKKATRSFQVVSQAAVTPDTGASTPGESLELKFVDAQKKDRILSGVTWTVESGSALVDSSGKLTFTGTGKVVVKGTIGKLTATATFYSITGLRVEPANPIVTPGDTLQFTVKQADGSAYAGPVKWSVEGTGAMMPDGKYIAGNGSGAVVVKAQAAGVAGTAAVTVVSRIEVQPGPMLSMMKGKTQQFAARAYSATGTEVTVPITWSVDGSVGILGADGMFVATGSGSGIVTAKYGKVSQYTKVTISGDPYIVVVSASRTSFAANGSTPITLTATVKDSSGNVVNMDTPIQFVVSDATKGTLSSTSVRTQNGEAATTFTPSTRTGTFRISAAATDLAIMVGYVDLSTYIPSPAKIKIVASPNQIAAATNSRTSVAAVLVDSEGYEIPNASGYQYNVTLSLANNSSTGATLLSSSLSIGPNQSRAETVLVAGSAGGLTIHGFSSLPVDSAAVQVIPVGPAAKIVVRSGILQTVADGVKDMTVYAEIQDANGTVRTQDFGVSMTLTAQFEDGTTLTTQTATTQYGLATFKVRSRKAGNVTFRITGVGLQSNLGAGTFTAGTPAKIRLSAVPTADVAADSVSMVRLRAEITDTNDNVVPNAGGTISFLRVVNNNATTMPAVTAVPASNGAAELVLTSTIYPAADQYKATMSGMADSNVVMIQSRITGLPYKVVGDVVTPTTTVGSTVQVRAYLKDSRSQIVTSATGRIVRVVPNSSTAVVTGSGFTDSGVATFTVTDSRAGSVTLTITCDGLQSDTRTITFTGGTLAQVVLKVSSPEMSADNGMSYVQLSAEAQDIHGNRIYQNIPVNVFVDHSDIATLSGNTVYTGSTVLIRSTSKPGTVTINGTGSVPVTPVSVSTFTPGVPAKVRVEPVTTAQVGQGTSFRVQVIDTYGHALTSINSGVSASAMGLRLTGTSGSTTTITNNNNLGLYGFIGDGRTQGATAIASGTATFVYTNTKAETVTVTPVFYYNGVQLPAESGSITTTPGNAVALQVHPARNGLSNVSPEGMLVEATLVDAFQNPVPSTDVDTFTFSLNTADYLRVSGSNVVTAPAGRASIQVVSQVKAYGGSTVITARSSRTGLSGSATIVTDTAPSQPVLLVSDASGADTVLQSGEISARVVVTVERRSGPQTILVYVIGFQITMYTDIACTAIGNTIGAGSTVLVGYVKRSDLSSGINGFRVVVQNDVGSSPMSNVQNITVQ